MSRNIVFGFRTDERRKFVVDVRAICETINHEDVPFSDDYYVFVTEKERDEFAEKELELGSKVQSTVSNTEPKNYMVQLTTKQINKYEKFPSYGFN